MSATEIKAAAERANQAMAMAAALIKDHRETLERVIGECRHAEARRPFVAPVLMSESERRIAAQTLAPIYIAALAFEKVYSERTAAIKAAAAKVGASA